MPKVRIIVAVAFSVSLAACSSKQTAPPAATPVAESTAPRLFVTNEISGDMTVIDTGTAQVIATVPLGKRPRGIHASPDHKTIYVALSGSPIGGPNVDESTLPPPDHSFDGIGVVDVKTLKLTKILKSGNDPENFDVSKDGKQIYISNEDDGLVSILDVNSGTLVKSLKMGAQPEEFR